MKFKFSIPKTFDWLLFLIPIILTAAGLAVIYSLTYYNDKIDLFYSQLVYAAIGIIIMIVLTFWDYRNLKGVAFYGYLAGLILLLAVLFFGEKTLGATRWLDIGITQLQPSEFMKIFLVIFIARILSGKVGEMRFRDIILVGTITIIPSLLILKQPDLGTVTVLIFGMLVMIFSAKLSSKQIFAIIGIILIAIPSVWFLLKDYQKERIYTFLDPASDPSGSKKV